MSNKIRVLLLLIAGIFFLGLAAFAEDPIQTEQYFNPQLGRNIEVAAGQILVKFKPSISSQSINALNAANQVKVITRLPRIGVYQLSGGATVAELLAAYRADPSVEYAEPNNIGSAQITTPNDLYLSKQWGLTNIKALQAWDIQTGSSSVIIAVVDSGTDLTHEDLQNRVMAGYDYVDNDNDPSDTFGHGTHVSGIIGAQANNGLGVAGVNWDCRIMPIRVLGTDGRGLSSNFALGVTYAADHGAKVINMSLALDPAGTQNATLTNAIIYARNTKGCVVVAAAGNDGDNSIRYPGADPGVVCVAALDQYDARASYSNANAYVDVCAPGGMGTGGALHSLTRVFSTMPSYDVTMVTASGYYKFYDTMDGTSMATPFVSGFAGLLLAQNPTWTNIQVENAITSEVDHLGSGAAGARNDIFGYGRINLYKAFNNTPPAPPTAPLGRQDHNRIVVSWTASTNTNVEKYYVYRSSAAVGPFTLIASTDAATLSYSDPITQEGTYYYEIGAVDAAGLASSLTAATSVTVTFSVADIYVYPNPLIVTPSAALTFAGLSGNETIRIYTLAGELVRANTLTSGTTWNWDAKNAAGKLVARGVYLYLITKPTGEKKIGKFAVIG